MGDSAASQGLAWFGTTDVLGISLTNWATAIGAMLLSFGVASVGLRWLITRAARLAGRSTNQVDDTLVELLRGTSRWLLMLVCVLIGVGLLDLPARWSARVGQLWFVVLMVQVALWCSAAITIVLRRHAARHAGSGVAAPASAAATLMSWGLRSVLWAVVALAMLANLGVNVTAFVASLGVGGIAVALAVQNILGDLFASLAIAIDKPFEVGDAIAVAGQSGTVEHIGLKTTRLRSPDGEQIVMSNADMLKNPVSNYKRLAERRVVLNFGVTYTTTPDQAAALPALVERIVRASDQLRFDRAHLQKLGESSIDYEVVYVVLGSNYQLHMDQKQRIVLELLREFGRLGIEFAFPTRTVVLTHAEPAPPADAAPVPPPARLPLRAAADRDRQVP